MNKAMLVIIVVLVLIGLPIGWYLVSPLFLNVVVNETIPVQESVVNVTTENIQEKVMTIREGIFIDADSFHKTSGIVKIIESGDKTYLRLENFKTTNGPDLKVYLSNDLEAKSYVSLGELKGNIGDQNYEIAQDIDVSQYKYALIWCEAFSVLFGSAELK